MNIEIFRDSAAFIELALPLLGKDEAANNLMLGVALRLKRSPNAFGAGPPFLCAVYENDAPVLLALMTPPQPLQLSAFQDKSREAINCVVEALREEGRNISGVMAESNVATHFSEAWTPRTECSTHLHGTHRLHECRRVNKLTYSQGQFRTARAEETERIAQWFLEFQDEAGLAVPHDMDTVRKRTASDIADGDIFVWDCGGAVSMARRIRPTAHGACIGGVFTPTQFRNAGYATSLVACLTQRILDADKEFACLFTDLKNPTSNNIYRNIGYEPVRDMLYYVFTQ